LMREWPYDGVTGGKTGYIDESGHTLVTTAEKDGISLIVVTLESPSQEIAYGDTTTLLDYAFNNFKTTLIPKGTILPLGKDEYKTKQDVYFTQPSNQTVTMEMQPDGTLEIFDENKGLLTSLKLEDLKVQANKEKEGAQEKEKPIILMPFITFGFLLAFTAFVLGYKMKVQAGKRSERGF
jgi:serine-type D-Ala-D-Ala carboxypeptidase (penicillin-binding protein 5/6)